MEQTKSKFLRHEACSSCGSSDARAIYEDGSEYCFSCKDFKKSDETSCTTHKHKHDHKHEEVVADTEHKIIEKIYYKGEPLQLKSRGLKTETSKYFGVLTDSKSNTVFPLYDRKRLGELVATKIRKAGQKAFAITGNFKRAQLFGQNLFKEGGKYLTITEGYEDCMSAYEMLGSKFPVVSIHTASSAVKDILDNLDFVESFEQVILCFDADKVGIEAMQNVAEKLSPGKVKIVNMNLYKDANEYLKNGMATQFVNSWWQAKVYTSVDIISANDAWNLVEKSFYNEVMPLPTSMPKLAQMLDDLEAGEITVIAANTSIGKTTFVNNLVWGFLNDTDINVGYLGIETTVSEIILSLTGLYAGRKFKKKKEKDRADAREMFDKNIEKFSKLKLIDHNGSIELDALIKKVRNTIITFNCKVFIIDPLQSALENLENDTVKHAMDQLQKLALQTGVSLIVVSHSRKPGDKDPHSVSEYDILGSSAINQIAFNTILLSRDKMAEDEFERNSTRIKIAKARRSGDTGEAGWLYYDKETGRLEESVDPKIGSGSVDKASNKKK